MSPDTGQTLYGGSTAVYEVAVMLYIVCSHILVHCSRQVLHAERKRVSPQISKVRRPQLDLLTSRTLSRSPRSLDRFLLVLHLACNLTENVEPADRQAPKRQRTSMRACVQHLQLVWDEPTSAPALSCRRKQGRGVSCSKGTCFRERGYPDGESCTGSDAEVRVTATAQSNPTR